jgi:hypothetical protein
MGVFKDICKYVYIYIYVRTYVLNPPIYFKAEKIR